MTARSGIGWRIVLLAAAGALLWGCGSVRGPAPVTYGGAGETSPPGRAAERAGEARPGEARPGEVAVRRGDTLYAIARRHRVPLGDMIRANGLNAPYRIHPGQLLRLPTARMHVVRAGDTISELAERYGVGSRSLVRLNDIPPPYRIRVGQRLRIPGRQTAAPRAAAERPAPSTARPPAPSAPKRGGTAGANRKPAAIGKPPPRARKRFLWPVRGRVIVGYGPQGGGRYNDGINILAAKGAAVRAAENGVVAYSGNELRGFGRLLLIKHAGGWMTAYAHNDALLVKTGQVVKRGQPISRVGNTGSVRRPQLHFELRRGPKALNPIKYLAPASAASRRGLPPEAPRHADVPDAGFEELAALGAEAEPGVEAGGRGLGVEHYGRGAGGGRIGDDPLHQRAAQPDPSPALAHRHPFDLDLAAVEGAGAGDADRRAALAQQVMPADAVEAVDLVGFAHPLLAAEHGVANRERRRHALLVGHDLDLWHRPPHGPGGGAGLSSPQSL